jgi:hypothetical protein
MVEEKKDRHLRNLLLVISKTIDRQVLGLSTFIAFYNNHRSIAYLTDKLLQVTVGGLRYTGKLERLEHRYKVEDKYYSFPYISSSFFLFSFFFFF